MINRIKSAGLTLVELCASLAIVAIVSAYALPAFSQWVKRYRYETAIESIRDSLVFARSAAIRESRLTIACPWSKKTGCHSDWTSQIAVFIDSNHDLQPDNGKILRFFEAEPPGSLTPRPASKRYFRFSPTGLLHGQAGGFVFCPEAGSPMSELKYMAINFGGRARLVSDNNMDGEITTSSGDLLSCKP